MKDAEVLRGRSQWQPSDKLRIAIVTTDVREFKRDYRSPIATFGTAPTGLLEGLARVPEAEVHVLSCARQPMKSREKLADNTWFHSLHVPRIGWMRTAYQGCIRATRRKLRQIKPDIVHGQGTELDCALDAVFSGFPNVITIHGNMRLHARLMAAKPFTFMWLAARLERLTLPRSQGVICITHYTRDAVADLARRTWILPNAVESLFFEVNAQRPSREVPKILCVGDICARKNQNAFILALDRLAKKRKFEVVFLGAGRPEDPYLIEFSHLLESRPWCTRNGFVSREQLRSHLGQAALLALPSLEDNCPMVVLEAMAAGVPVVAARVGGVPDLIEENETGWFCDPLEGSSISAAIERVLSNPSGAAEMAGLAKLSARARFHPDVIARRQMEIYQEVVSRPR
jgi:glycosyltransferase involved in cell wall biosynthesis